MKRACCGKNCSECHMAAEVSCRGCAERAENGPADGCRIALCCAKNGVSCTGCAERAGCTVAGRGELRRDRQRRKRLRPLFWLLLPSVLLSALGSGFTPARELAQALDLPLQAAYGICLLRLSGAGFHYHRAGILRLAAAAVLAAFAYMAASGSHAVGPTRFVAVTALVLEFAGEYCEYSGHMAILDREDDALAGSWERLRRWLSGMTAVSFGAALCALLRVLGLLSTLAALASMLGMTVVEVIKLSLLYRTAEVFSRN